MVSMVIEPIEPSGCSDDLLKKTIRPAHSVFTERTNLSACAFKFGGQVTVLKQRALHA